MARLTRSRPLLLAVAVLALAVLVGSALSDQAVSEAARGQTERFADPLDRLCTVEPAAAARLRAPCPEVAEVAREGVAGSGRVRAPVDGTDGVDGRGVVSADLVAGRLVLTYTDGSVLDLGPVVGEDGTDGEDGEPGTDGTDGERGPGVRSVAIEGGRLLVTFTDGEQLDAGRVVGRDGRDGRDGTDGEDGTDGDRGPVGPPGPVCPPGFEPVTGTAVVGGIEFARAAVCVDPSSAQTPTTAPTTAPAQTPTPTPTGAPSASPGTEEGPP